MKINGTSGVSADIQGPHVGECLALCADILHCPRAYRLLAGGESAIIVVHPEDLEEGDQIINHFQPWINMKGSAEGPLMLPLMMHGGGM